MSIGKQLADFFGGSADAVLARFIEDKDKRLEARSALLSEALTNERSFVDAARDVIVAEAQSDSFLARNWRPAVMLMFAVMVGKEAFLGDLANIPERMWSLLQLGIGGYVVGRSAEKIAKEVGPALGGQK